MRYAGIELDDVANGEGLGAVFFVQGCPHHCLGCQNPQTWNPDRGIECDDTDLFSLMEYFEDVPCASRLTISGGDPLWGLNLALTWKVADIYKNHFPKRKLWIYTGFTWEQILERMKKEKAEEHLMRYLNEVINLCDVLVDGKFILKDRDITLKFKGSSNQRIINVPQSLATNEIVLWK